MVKEEQRDSLDWQKKRLERNDHGSFSKPLVSIPDMLRKKRKWNHKRSTKTTKDGKGVEDKIGEKNKSNK